MFIKVLLNYVLSADACLLAVTLVLILRGRTFKQMPFFTGLMAVCAAQTALDVAVMFHRKSLGISSRQACEIFYYSGWAVQILGSVLIFLSIYSIFRLLMKPMRGLERIGGLLFRWVGGVAVFLACLIVFGPHPAGTTIYATLCVQVQEGVSILTLCLLLAVCLATRPLGLTFRSRIFGATLGLGVLSMATLIEAPWVSTAAAGSPYSWIHLIGGFGCLLAGGVWTVYFARPEPARKMITLPTTSPFFFWNRIAEALGDEPGEVAVSGITPEMFAPAELMALRAPKRQPAPVVEMPHIAQR